MFSEPSELQKEVGDLYNLLARAKLDGHSDPQTTTGITKELLDLDDVRD